jgi:hypothetical protein
MTDDELSRALERLAERGGDRGADAVFAAATVPRRDRRPVYVLAAVAAAAVVALVVGPLVVDGDDTPDRLVAATGVAELPLRSAEVRAPIVAVGDLLFGTGPGPTVQRSADGGATWTSVELPELGATIDSVRISAVEGGNLVAIVEGSTVEVSSGGTKPYSAALSTTDGDDWVQIDGEARHGAASLCEGTVEVGGAAYETPDCAELLQDRSSIATPNPGRRFASPLAWRGELRVPVIDGDDRVVSFLTIER